MGAAHSYGRARFPLSCVGSSARGSLCGSRVAARVSHLSAALYDRLRRLGMGLRAAPQRIPSREGKFGMSASLISPRVLGSVSEPLASLASLGYS